MPVVALPQDGSGVPGIRGFQGQRIWEPLSSGGLVSTELTHCHTMTVIV